MPHGTDAPRRWSGVGEAVRERLRANKQKIGSRGGAEMLHLARLLRVSAHVVRGAALAAF
jgi:hypothetical protein